MKSEMMWGVAVPHAPIIGGHCIIAIHRREGEADEEAKCLRDAANAGKMDEEFKGTTTARIRVTVLRVKSLTQN